MGAHLKGFFDVEGTSHKVGHSYQIKVGKTVIIDLLIGAWYQGIPKAANGSIHMYGPRECINPSSEGCFDM